MKQNLHIGLDVGAIAVKAAICVTSYDIDNIEFKNYKPVEHSQLPEPVYVRDYQRSHGAPQRVIEDIFQELATMVNMTHIANVVITGSHSKELAHDYGFHFINDFKAVATGVGLLNPSVHTILEMGGDTSKYLRIAVAAGEKNVRIFDYSMNGDCAAGTGSFIDQQASRMRYAVEDIGALVICTDCAARIAGRCSVFAKSDMIHAQQRGFEPGAILKGLCEAVVRNFKGTVLRGKEMAATVAFVGGVALNAGVVAAMRAVIGMDLDLVVPIFPAHYGAIGAALTGRDLPLTKMIPAKSKKAVKTIAFPTMAALDSSRVLQLRDLKATTEKPDTGIVPAFLGIDVGSVSTNLVVMAENGQVLHEIYTKTDSRPIAVVRRSLKEIMASVGSRVSILGVGTTGSGRELSGELVGADTVNDEITAHKTGAAFIAKKMLNSTVDTIFEIGGQDSKYIAIEDGVIVDFAMNEACAAGTGSFLEEQAERMQISIVDDFARLALSSRQPLRLGERCTVFMEKDVVNFLQRGASKADISAGLAFSIALNYLNRIVQGRKIGDKIFFQGGTAYNDAVAAAFATILDKQIIVPPHNGVMGAIGAALLARQKYHRLKYHTRFRGFDIDESSYSVRSFTCRGCTNECEIQEFTIAKEKSYWGDRCSDRYRKRKMRRRQATVPDLLVSRQHLLLQDSRGPNGLTLKIGIPRSLYYFDLFPLWQAYFNTLGAEVILSDHTQRDIINRGQEACLAEPCFPIIVSFGHVADLIEKNVDYLFLPNIINAETDFPEQESWLCPWGQTLPYVVRSAPKFTAWFDRILAPHIRLREPIRRLQSAFHETAHRLGVSRARSDQALEYAVKIQQKFYQDWRALGRQAFNNVMTRNDDAVVIIGRPYNIFDAGVNLDIPTKLRKLYGINVLPMDCLPLSGIDIKDVHENMFWNYGRKILQAAKFVSQYDNLHVIYFTNFKCGPDSYIKHFIKDALKKPFLVLQFDGHSNDAGILTRCEAFLQGKGLLDEPIKPEKCQRLERKVH